MRERKDNRSSQNKRANANKPSSKPNSKLAGKPVNKAGNKPGAKFAGNKPNTNRTVKPVRSDGAVMGKQSPQRGNKFRGKGGQRSGSGALHIFGLHTVRAAFENPKRKIIRLLTTPNAWERLDIGDMGDMPFPVEIIEAREMDKMLGKDAIHQGIIAEVHPLHGKSLEELKDTHLVVVLDEVTDPHNVGAIMRSAVAMGAGALITTARNSPQETGVLAKSASGALEMIDHIQVKNLGHAIDELHFLGFQTIGLDSEGPHALEETFSKKQIALVLGAEGKGLRHKTRTIVSDLARLDMPGAIKSLNVSNAATLSLYAAHRYILS